MKRKKRTKAPREGEKQKKTMSRGKQLAGALIFSLARTRKPFYALARLIIFHIRKMKRHEQRTQSLQAECFALLDFIRQSDTPFFFKVPFFNTICYVAHKLPHVYHVL